MLTVLFDLDDTLINNNPEQFTKVYLGLLGNHLQPMIDAKIMLPALLEGTRQMVEKTTIANTLEQTFDSSFYPAIGKSKESLAAAIADFYQNIFPVLEPQTSPKPGAVEVIQECLAKGWQIAVATNPLFPKAAVFHRLDWAGLKKGKTPFATISSFETYHFAKPQPSFFSEVIARIGAFDHPVVMIGNDLADDILPAGKAGLPVFWLSSNDQPLPLDLPNGSKKGSMEEILPWLEGIENSWKQENPRTISSILASLRGGAAAIDALLINLGEDAWNFKPLEYEWNITEIICHLRDVDKDVNLPRIDTIFNESQPFIAGIETDLWAEERGYLYENGKTALQDFLTFRQTLVDKLQALPQESWTKQFRHTIFGPSNIQEIMGFTVSHDNNHIKQISNLIDLKMVI